jgi:type I restriction enzyme, S subunit
VTSPDLAAPVEAAPPSWKRLRLKLTIRACQNGLWGEEPDGVNDVAVVRVADFDRAGRRVRPEIPTLRSVEPHKLRARLLQAGDLLIEKSGGGEGQPVGTVVTFDGGLKAICSNFVARMPVRSGFDSRFLCYLHASLYFARVQTKSIKQTTGIQNLDSDSYLNEVVALPAFEEQRRIAEFLDRKTAAIDVLINKKKQLIELLQEKRHSVITQAVTKGLDPTVPMKESGVEWLGAIPAHWEALALKYSVVDVIDCKNRTPDYVEESRYAVVRTPNVRDGQFVINELLYTDNTGYIEWTRRGIPSSGDVLFTREAPAGEACLVPSSPLVCLGQRMMLFRIGSQGRLVDADFVLFSVYGPQVQEVVRSESMGSTVTHLRVDQVRNLPFLVPPADEQRAIGTFLRRETGHIDGLIARIRVGNEQLVEYRQALISAAVTGQLDPSKKAA